MSAWLALVADLPADASAAPSVRGDAEGWLAVWTQDDAPVSGALRADPAAFDPDGAPATASYVLVDPGRAVLFDDPAVQHARRRILAGTWRTVTTLVSDPVHFRGSLVVGATDDPFAQIAPALRLEVGAGLLRAGPVVLPAPVIERYAGRPWPQAGFR